MTDLKMASADNPYNSPIRQWVVNYLNREFSKIKVYHSDSEIDKECQVLKTWTQTTQRQEMANKAGYHYLPKIWSEKSTFSTCTSFIAILVTRIRQNGGLMPKKGMPKLRVFQTFDLEANGASFHRYPSSDAKPDVGDILVYGKRLQFSARLKEKYMASPIDKIFRTIIIASFLYLILISVSPADAQTRKASKSMARQNPSVQKIKIGESLTRKVGDRTAISPIYGISSKNCQNKDKYASEGEDFYRECKAWGNYLLRASGSGYHVNYGIVSKNRQSDFLVMMFPLSASEAAKYERADLYDQKLGDEIEWQLDERGNPFAVIVRAAFYKNIGSAKTFKNPKNKIAEFYFVRGLTGYEDLREDIPAVQTAYNPLEQSRAIAAEYLEKRGK